jgi:hypothetical protein
MFTAGLGVLGRQGPQAFMVQVQCAPSDLTPPLPGREQELEEGAEGITDALRGQISSKLRKRVRASSPSRAMPFTIGVASISAGDRRACDPPRIKRPPKLASAVVGHSAPDLSDEDIQLRGEPARRLREEIKRRVAEQR